MSMTLNVRLDMIRLDEVGTILKPVLDGLTGPHLMPYRPSRYRLGESILIGVFVVAQGLRREIRDDGQLRVAMNVGGPQQGFAQGDLLVRRQRAIFSS